MECRSYQTCLTLYCRSPRCYEDLQKSGFLCLPSSRLIQIYKNKVSQQAGIQRHALEWMRNEALNQNLSTEGYEGGIIIDEMAIQEDLAIKKGNIFQLVAFVQGNDESFSMQKILTNNNEIQLANHVLQLVFLGSSGFRFPFAHFPTKQISASELYLIFRKAVKMLALYGFVVRYVSMDGAQTNRDFMKMLLLKNKKTDTLQSMLVTNIFRPSLPKISIIMDYSHVVKKIRNNCCKSGLRSVHNRKLFLRSSLSVWDHWVQAFQWDVSENPYPIHRKLTHEHYFPTSESKMRNHLAEDVLDKNMLHLMSCYRNSLSDATKSAELRGTIEFLQQTSVLVKNFRDSRPIKDYGDDRLQQNRDVLSWFKRWEHENKSNNEVTEKEKSLLSFQCREDIVSLLVGFDEFSREKLQKSGGSIIPNRINSDVIENVFSQQRGLHNGNNSNPTYQH